MLLSYVNVEFVHAASSVRSVICDANERSFSPLAECSGVEASGARCSRAVHHLGSCIAVATYELTESPCDVFHFRQFDAHPLARRVRDIPGSLQAGTLTREGASSEKLMQRLGLVLICAPLLLRCFSHIRRRDGSSRP